MIKYFKLILGVATVFISVVTLQAQTYNDTVRTNTWSVYMQGGASSYHGVRSALFDNSKRTIAPDFDLGVKYNIKPWVRLGLNVGYTMLKSTNKYVSSSTTIQNNFMVADYPTTLETKIDRLQNRNNTHLLGADINTDFNILDIWHNRKTQWINLYAGVGVGYMHGWNRNSQTYAYSESAVAKGEGYYNVYSHTYMKSNADKSQFNTLYVPLSLSLEFDISRQLTVGAIAQYKYLPIKKDLTPKGIYSAGVVIRYNFVKSKSKLQQNQIRDLYSRIEAGRVNCAGEQAAIRNKADEKEARMAKQIAEQKLLLDERSNTIAKLERENIGTAVYFENNSTELSEDGKKGLSRLAEQLKDDQRITVIGSANTTGYTKHNQKLSDNRCEVVMKYLLDKGVKKEQFKLSLSLGDRGMTIEPDCRRVVIIVQ